MQLSIPLILICELFQNGGTSILWAASLNCVRQGHGDDDEVVRDSWQSPLRHWHARCLWPRTDLVFVIESRVEIVVEVHTNGGRNVPLEVYCLIKLLIEAH